MSFTIRIIGCIFVIICTTYTGFQMSRNLKNRLKDIIWYCSAIEMISQKINYTGQEIHKIVTVLPCSDNYYSVYLPFLVRLKKSNLKKQDEELINEFFSELGMGDSEGQNKRCIFYKNELLVRRQFLEKEVAQKSRIYNMLGFFAGLSLSVILI